MSPVLDLIVVSIVFELVVESPVVKIVVVSPVLELGGVSSVPAPVVVSETIVSKIVVSKIVGVVTSLIGDSVVSMTKLVVVLTMSVLVDVSILPKVEVVSIKIDSVVTVETRLSETVD